MEGNVRVRNDHSISISYCRVSGMDRGSNFHEKTLHTYILKLY